MITLKHLPCTQCLMSFPKVLLSIPCQRLCQNQQMHRIGFFPEFSTESIKGHLRLNICSVVEYPFLKPACTCDKMFSSSTNFVILSLIMEVKSLPKQLSKVMPL